MHFNMHERKYLLCMLKSISLDVINYSIEQFKVDEWLEIRHDHGDEEEEKNHESITNERKSNFLTTK